MLTAVPLALQSSEPILNDRVLSAARRLGVAAPALRCETFPQLFSAVVSGAYAAVLPSLAEDALPSKAVTAIEIPGASATKVKIRLAWHPRSVRRRAGFETLAEALRGCLTRDE